MNLISIIKKLLVLDVIFDVRAKKLAGINDRLNVTVDAAISFDSITNTITCANTSVIPDWCKKDKYFRCNLTGYTPIMPPNPPSPPVVFNPATNHYKLFCVESAAVVASQLIITINPLAAGVNPIATFGPVAGKIDARICTITNNGVICRQDVNGSTIYNTHNFSGTGLPDGSGVAQAVASHYHGADSSIVDPPYSQHFAIGDWLSLAPGDLYYIDINHNLNTLIPNVTVFEDSGSEIVWTHKTSVVDALNVRIYVSQRGADARFDGTIKVEKY